MSIVVVISSHFILVLKHIYSTFIDFTIRDTIPQYCGLVKFQTAKIASDGSFTAGNKSPQ